MPINAGYEFMNAEKDYLNAVSLEEKISRLEQMIRVAPKHKGSENLLAELKTRLKKFREKQERVKKSGGGRRGIKKEGYQVILLGLTNSGKSSLLARLTNARPEISSNMFTTKEPMIGTMDYDGVKAQVVDIPSTGSENFDIGMVNTADCLLIVVEKLDDVVSVEKILSRAIGKKIIVVNKADLLDDNSLRKLRERIKAKKLNAVVVSCDSGLGIDELKKRVFEEMNMIRVYTKEPGKEKTREPILLHVGATVRDVAEKILKGFSSRVKEAQVTGPSGKFPNQKVGLAHELKDLDVVEFKTK